MTVKRALLAVALGTTIGTSYALWDERDRGPAASAPTTPAPGANGFAAAPAATPPIAPERVIPAAALVKADAGTGALPLPPAPPPSTPRDRLFADLERAKLEAPPEVDRLVKMQRKGAKPRALRAYVRTRFPKNARLRLVVGRWIKSLEPPRAARQARARAGL